MTKLVIVTPVHNQLFFTKQFLKSLEKQTFKDFAVVIVNNASTDETKAWLSETTITTINNLENRGYSGGCNDGIKLALEKYPDADILVTNNDMELSETCLEELVKAKETLSDGGIFGGRLLFPDGRINHAGAYLNAFGWGQHKFAGVNSSDLIETEPSEVEYTTGALFFLTNPCIKQLGGFDERFNPAYFEEVDFCTIARQKGFKTYYIPTATAIHYENKTAVDVFGGMDKVSKLSRLNQIKYYTKHDDDVYVPTSDKKALITGKIYGDWSFSIVLRNLAKGLKRNGVDVAIASEEYHQKQAMDEWEIQEMIKKPHDYWDRVVMRSSEGDHQYLMPPGKKRIAHTSFEGTHPPSEWVRQLNHVDNVVVNSSFCKNILEDRGVKTPISIIPNPVDTKLFTPEGKLMEIDGRRSFGFLFMSAFGERKNMEAVLKAFILEFKPDEDVYLFVHSLSWFYVLQQAGTDVKKWITESVMGGTMPPHAPIIPTSMSLHPSVLPNLIRAHQCNLLVSRAEGFGNSLVESAACGVPSIATNYSGMKDWISDESTGYPLNDFKLTDMPLQVLPYYQNYIGSKWAEVDIDSLRAKMRYVFEHQEEAKEKGKKARERSLQYDIMPVGKMLKDVMFE